MRIKHPHRFRDSGFTLTEILVVVVLVSMAAAVIGFSFQRLLASNNALERRQEREQAARNALATFAADVRAAKAILAASPEKISLWDADSDSDGTASLPELVNYTFIRDGDAPAPWIRETWNARAALLTLTDLRVATDTAPPGTGHVVVHLAVGAENEPHWIGTSVMKRERYRAPSQ